MTRIAVILAAGLLLVMAFRYALGCPCRRIDSAYTVPLERDDRTVGLG